MYLTFFNVCNRFWFLSNSTCFFSIFASRLLSVAETFSISDFVLAILVLANSTASFTADSIRFISINVLILEFLISCNNHVINNFYFICEQVTEICNTTLLIYKCVTTRRSTSFLNSSNIDAPLMVTCDAKSLDIFKSWIYNNNW